MAASFPSTSSAKALDSSLRIRLLVGRSLSTISALLNAAPRFSLRQPEQEFGQSDHGIGCLLELAIEFF